jgi:tRNA A22 N-methylase
MSSHRLSPYAVIVDNVHHKDTGKRKHAHIRLLHSTNMRKASTAAVSLLVVGSFRVGTLSFVRSFKFGCCRPKHHVFPQTNGRQSTFTMLQLRHFSSFPDDSWIDSLSSTTTTNSDFNVSRSKAQDAFSVLTRQGRAWKRLSHMVDLAIGAASHNESSLMNAGKTISDVGTDHGLLAMGLALSGEFSKVIGVDVSEQALENGAFTLLEQVNKRVKFNIPVEFRHGDGLRALNDGEAAVVCIAGIGVNTILQILGLDGSDPNADFSELDRIQCTDIVLQPTNSKPKNLMVLYKTLQENGWKVRNERIENVSSRWYVTSHFARDEEDRPAGNKKSGCLSDDGDLVVPGAIIASLLESVHPMRQVLDQYCLHHQKWIRQDEKFGRLDPLEKVWLDQFGEQS